MSINNIPTIPSTGSNAHFIFLEVSQNNSRTFHLVKLHVLALFLRNGKNKRNSWGPLSKEYKRNVSRSLHEFPADECGDLE